MLLKDKIVQMNTGFKGPKLVLLKERLGTQVFLLLNEINLVRMGPSTCLLNPSLQFRFKDCFSQGSIASSVTVDQILQVHENFSIMQL